MKETAICMKKDDIAENGDYINVWKEFRSIFQDLEFQEVDEYGDWTQLEL